MAARRKHRYTKRWDFAIPTKALQLKAFIMRQRASLVLGGTSPGAVLRDYYDGSGMRSGAFDMQWSMGELRFGTKYRMRPRAIGRTRR
jgi:hypothetical protein